MRRQEVLNIEITPQLILLYYRMPVGVGWKCKYHIVFITYYREQKLNANVRRRISEISQKLCSYKNTEIIARRTMPDNVHMCLSCPLKHSLSRTIGSINGRSAIKITRVLLDTTSYGRVY